MPSRLTGITRGLPKADIATQSKVNRPIPKPLMEPKRLFTTTLFGAIQQTQLKMLSPVHRYPGTQYHTKLHRHAK